MFESYRNVSDVIGDNPDLHRFWEEMPVTVRRQLLHSRITVDTLGELQLLCRQLERLS